MVSKLMKVRDF